MAAAGPWARASSASPAIRVAASAGGSSPVVAGSSSAIERISSGHPRASSKAMRPP